MSIVKPKNFSYIRGPKGDKGDRGEPGTGVVMATGRITYNASTKSIGFNDIGLATVEYVNTTVNNLINGAPLLLDTLNELAAAIGNNPNFITDITVDLNSKLSLSGGTMTGALILNANPTTNLQAATKQYVDNATLGVTVYSTDDVPEGANKYYTDSRARSAISVTGNLSYNSSTGVISYTEPGRGINDLTDVDTITNPPTNGQVLAWNSAESIWKPNTISGSGGNSSGTPINISITTYDYDAIAGQTVFSGSDSNSVLLIMSPGNYIQVYKNGSLLRSEINWTYNIGVPGGDNITLSAPANAEDWIHIEVKDITNISEDLILDAGGYDSSGSVIDCGEYNGS